MTARPSFSPSPFAPALPPSSDTLPAPQTGAGVLAGEPVDRRTVLRGALRSATAAGIVLAVPGALAGCATYVVNKRIPGYIVALAPLAPGVQALINARAAEVGIAPPYVSSQGGGALAGFAEQNRSGGAFDPVTDRYPHGTDLIVVSSGADDSVAKTVIGQGVQVITYLAPLRHQTAQISIAPGALGGLLAAHAAEWARTRLGGRGSAVFVTGIPPYGSRVWISEHGPPPPGPPPAVAVSPEEHAIRTAFARAIPQIALTAVQADYVTYDPVRAVKADPHLRIVLCADDALAANVARLLREALPRARRKDVFVGGVGTPSIGQGLEPFSEGSSGGGLGLVESTLRELGRDDVLRAIATIRLRSLADALVDLPAALMRGGSPYDIAVPPILLTPGSAPLAQYVRDSGR